MTVQLFLDRSPGEARGVVVRDSRPERLLIEREGDLTPRLGAGYLGRVAALSDRMGLARIDLGLGAGAGEAASLKLSGVTPITQGALLAVEVVAEPARGKGALVRLTQPAQTGKPGLISPAPPILQRLRAFAPEAELVQGDEARDVADDAQAEALSRTHILPGGLTLAIEPTRALVAVDVDLAETGAPKGTLNANLAAIDHAARLLRLKALSGLVVIDLIGFPKEHARLHAAARTAFAADGPEVVIAPVSRFGALELSKPRRDQPLPERLLDADGGVSAENLALALARSLERQGRFQPGARLTAVCAPQVAGPLRSLVQTLGPRFGVREEVGRRRDDTDILTS